MKISVTAPNIADLRRQARAFDDAQAKAMHLAVDRATSVAQKNVKQRIKTVGLGRLAGAIGATSSEKKRRRAKDNAWGAIYAKGGADSRAGGALESYTEGATIRGRNVQWIAIPTRALPKKAGRYKMTPKRYVEQGNPLGPLVFKKVSNKLAYLIAQGDVTVSVKTGRAKSFAGRVTRSRKKQRDVIAFTLIKETKRAKRFDQRALVARASNLVGQFLTQEMQQALPGVVEKG